MSSWEWYTEESEYTLKSRYFLEGEDVQGAARRISRSVAKYGQDESLEQRVYDLIEKGWIALPSPVWANLGTDRGLPISCFGSYVEDNMVGILDTLSEVGIMTKHGGGTSGYFGDLRPCGSEISGNGLSNGPVAFLKMYDSAMRVISQGARRGSFAAYMPIEHPDIEEFLKIKSRNNDIQDLSFGVTITDDFMREMIDGDLQKRKIWAKVLQARKEIGYPYIGFIDTVNRLKPRSYIESDMRIHASNLCNEIWLPSKEDESFVCCLTALNAEKYDEWKDSDIVDTVVRLLDAIMEEFIAKAEGIKHMERAVNFARRHRALGMGFTGWHSYLLSKRIPFDSFQAKALTHQIFKKIESDAIEATVALGQELGPAPYAMFGERNCALMAVAPNTTSSSIMGQCSPGIEPFNSNYFVAWLSSRTFPRKNKYLMQELEERGLNTDETWKSILDHGGSILHIEELSEIHEVFKTFGEINQYELLRQAGDRQKYIDQGQSLNIHIPPKTSVKEINAIHIHAWECGVKGLYYQRSKSPSSGFSLKDVCTSCAG
jgi:ribonucleoside-diphosphate reductase alpha chain